MGIIYHDDLIQGSPEWLALRNNYITGTDAYTLLRGKSIEYILDAKRNAKAFNGTKATRRGHTLEPVAVSILEEIKDIKVHHTGFITNDKYPIAGYSPDGLIGEDGLVECKAFNKERHYENQKRPDIMIISQIQWGMFVSQRKWAYLILFNPDLSPEDAIFIKLIERNEAAMSRFKELIEKES